MKDYIEKKYNNILMKFNVLLVRHGKSIWNHDKIYWMDKYTINRRRTIEFKNSTKIT